MDGDEWRVADERRTERNERMKKKTPTNSTRTANNNNNTKRFRVRIQRELPLLLVYLLQCKQINLVDNNLFLLFAQNPYVHCV